MKYRVLGRTGLNISEVSFGTVPLGVKNYIEVWDPDDAATQQSVQQTLLRALDLGYNYFDTAASYGEGRSEELLGRMLKDRQSDGFELLRLALTAPRFDAAAIERSRAQILASLRRETTNPNSIASKIWWQTAFPDHPYGRATNGTLESVPLLTAEDLKDFPELVPG